MANGAVIYTWGAPVRGREMQGLAVFGKALTFWDEQAKEGRIHGHREYFGLTGNATERTGTMIVEGELGELLRIQTEEDSLRLQTEASQICENFCVQICEMNSEESINRYVQTLEGMGLS